MLPCLVSVLLTFEIQSVLKFETKSPSPKGYLILRNAYILFNRIKYKPHERYEKIYIY